MVRLGYAYGASDVALTMAVLQASGFMVRCEDRAMGLTLTDWTTAIGGMAITVPDDQAEDAAAVLADLPPMVHHRPEALACVIILLIFLFSGAPPPAKGVYLRRTNPADSVIPA